MKAMIRLGYTFTVVNRNVTTAIKERTSELTNKLIAEQKAQEQALHDLRLTVFGFLLMAGARQGQCALMQEVSDLSAKHAVQCSLTRALVCR